jgi:hypothetical protein
MVDAKISKMASQISKKRWGGSRPNSGGRRPGSGRRKGTPNKVTTGDLADDARPLGVSRTWLYARQTRGPECPPTP